MQLVGNTLLFALNVFLALLFIRLVVDWVQVFARSWVPHGPILVVLEVIYSITDPPILFVRRFVPPLRIGSVALDTSFLIVLVVVYLLRILVANLFFVWLAGWCGCDDVVASQVGSPGNTPPNPRTGVSEYRGRGGGNATVISTTRDKG